MRKNIREEVGDFIIHIGWAMHGQECDCGHTIFNPLARAMNRPVFECYDDDLEPQNWQTRASYWLGSRLTSFATDYLLFPENRRIKRDFQKTLTPGVSND